MINKPFLKICGITRKEDLQVVVDSGAEAVGFIAFPKSPRYIAPEALKVLLTTADTSKILKVGVFVNASKEEIESYLDAGIDIIQLHGDETAEFAQSLNAPVWRALRLKESSQIEEYKDFPCEKFLVDSYVKGAEIPGGTGHLGDWSLAKGFIESVDKDVLLAGGLKASNLGDALNQVSPFGFDLSSGVEVSPGIKSAEKVAELITVLKSI
ncbi:MAG: phosphoribosylanthranilate isomerase [Lentisphaerales bacterium]|nr:phosphoribosylanthranilate isomerase [Lentisphaerales bacterium]